MAMGIKRQCSEGVFEIVEGRRVWKDVWSEVRCLERAAADRLWAADVRAKTMG